MNRPISYAFIDAQNLNLGMREENWNIQRNGRTRRDVPHPELPPS